MAPEPPRIPDDEPTEVTPAARESVDGPRDGAAGPAADRTSDAPEDVVSDAPLWPDSPRASHTTPPAPGDTAPPGSTVRDTDFDPYVDDVAAQSDATADERQAGGTRPPADGAPPAGEPAAKRRGRAGEGAKVAADRVSQAASATAQALRETDVSEIARNTTKLIENTRPFFLAAFAIVFTFLAAVEDHAAVGVVFALAAVLCVLGAAFSPSVDQVLKRGDHDRR